MVTLIQSGELQENGHPKSAVVVGLASEKPTEDIYNGWMFCELDTGKVYLYDEENATWREF